MPLHPAPFKTTEKHVVTGTPGVGLSLFGIYLLHRVLTATPRLVSSVIYRQTINSYNRVWAFEYSVVAGRWQRMTAASSVKTLELFFFDNGSTAIHTLDWLINSRNILITPPEVCGVERSKISTLPILIFSTHLDRLPAERGRRQFSNILFHADLDGRRAFGCGPKTQD